MRRRHTLYSYPFTAHFVTTVTVVRGNWFVEDAVCRRILLRFEECRQRFGLYCHGYVLMPDHIHALLRQTEEGLVVSRFMQAFKRETSAYARPIRYVSPSLWQARFDDVPVPGPRALTTKINYMHNNPPRRGIADSDDKYIWSSAQDYSAERCGIVCVTSPFTGEVLGKGRVDFGRVV